MIQKYIDGEVTPQEIALIENHIAICEKCSVKLYNQQRLTVSVKKAIKTK